MDLSYAVQADENSSLVVDQSCQLLYVYILENFTENSSVMTPVQLFLQFFNHNFYI